MIKACAGFLRHLVQVSICTLVVTGIEAGRINFRVFNRNVPTIIRQGSDFILYSEGIKLHWKDEHSGFFYLPDVARVRSPCAHVVHAIRKEDDGFASLNVVELLRNHVLDYIVNERPAVGWPEVNGFAQGFTVTRRAYQQPYSIIELDENHTVMRS